MTRPRGVLLLVLAVGAGVLAACATPDAPPLTSRPAADQRAAPMTASSEAGERASGGGHSPTGVRHHSARLEDVRPVEKPHPTRLRIDALGIDAPVVALGVAASGEMEVPTDAQTVAWYEHGPSPGQQGSAVLAAHVDYNGARGVFFDLAALEAGATVTVEFADARPRTFTVTEGNSVAKVALPLDQLFRRDGRPVLTLITCGGDFDPVTRSYRSNVVIRAKPSG
jgi:sortase (surface protein transpeptidase)